MPLYRYEALDATGNKVVGAMQVSDEPALRQRLAGLGYQPLHVETARRSLHLDPPTASGAPTAGAGSALTADEGSLARGLYQLHIAFRAGMPAYQAVTTVATQIHHADLRRVLTEIGLGVQQGQSLAAQMERYPRIFSRGDVGMIRAAELGGFLPEAFGYLARQHEEDHKTSRRLRIWQWFFHSQVLGLFLLLPCAIWLKEAIPKLSVVAGLAPAGQTLIFVTLPLSVAYCLGLASFNRLRRNPDFAARWHRMLMRLPMTAAIHRLRARAVFSRTLQQLVRAGVVYSTAWETAAGAVPNLYLGDRYQQATPVVKQTQRISSGLEASGEMEATDIGMVATGESTGDVPQALDYLANHYEEATRQALGASVVKGAALLVGYGVLLGAVAAALVAWCYGQGALGILAE